MKLRSIIIILVSIYVILIPQKSIASHYMGGEITWKCIPTGQANAGKFIFTMKVYRECGGITFTNYQTLNSNSPGGNIPMNLLPGWPKDISPTCAVDSFPNGINLQITCAGAEATGADNTGAISEYVYQSPPIQIIGVPPASGWVFYWGSCCRNPSTNVLATPGWKLRAKMFPYNSQNTYPCFDNSPTFAETARAVISAGYPFEYNNNAYDEDLDVLQFEWGQPLVNLTTPVTYAAGYSYTNPLPDTSHNLNNVPASIDINTGTISFTSYTTGAFVTSIKISSYKSNVLVAEIWRDIQVIMLAAGANTPPIVNPPFDNGTAFLDTVYAGDTVSFYLDAQDIEFFPNGLPQTMGITISGTQFGSYIPASSNNQATLSSSSGCLNPPCATITPAPHETVPINAIFGMQTYFHWITANNHLRVDNNGYMQATDYNFSITISDDYCPAPAITNSIIRITVLPYIPPFPESPEIKSVIVNTNGDVKLLWDAIENTYNLFDSYYIYCADNINGPYTLIDSILDPTINSYTHNANLIIKQNKYYYLSINQSYQDQVSIKSSSIISNIVLKDSISDLCIADLKWNAFSEIGNEKYYILKKEENSSWLLIDVLYQLNYTDTFTSESAEYRIELDMVQISDCFGNITNTITTSNPLIKSHNIDIGSDTTICEDESFVIIPTGSNYTNYEWSTGNNLNYLTVNGSDFGVGTHNISLIASTSYGCQSMDTMVLVVDNCTSINKIDKMRVDVFPNPNSGNFLLKFSDNLSQKIGVEISDINGRIVYQKKINGLKELNVDISNNANGTYIIRIKTKTEIVQKAITISK